MTDNIAEKSNPQAEHGECRNCVYVSVEYNGREIDGIDEFRRELEADYDCHFHNKWIPNCSEGGELWLKLLISLPLADVLKQLVGDIVIDAIKFAGKKVVLEPLKKAIGHLREANEKRFPLQILRSSFVVEDIEIVIGGLTAKDLADLDKIFGIIGRNLPIIEDYNSIGAVKIELPAELLPYNQKYGLEEQYRPLDSVVTDSIWIITYKDSSKALFNAGEGKIMGYR